MRKSSDRSREQGFVLARETSHIVSSGVCQHRATHFDHHDPPCCRISHALVSLPPLVFFCDAACKCECETSPTSPRCAHQDCPAVAMKKRFLREQYRFTTCAARDNEMGEPRGWLPRGGWPGSPLVRAIGRKRPSCVRRFKLGERGNAIKFGLLTH